MTEHEAMTAIIFAKNELRDLYEYRDYLTNLLPRNDIEHKLSGMKVRMRTLDIILTKAYNALGLDRSYADVEDEFRRNEEYFK